MVQLGFVIDHGKCIGCHACTVACKSENHVPLGSFRTWVKYTEAGSFPTVKRSFAVLRCNQCTDAPCMTICPTSALYKRADGIVDLDQNDCIGCKSCMQACPYDALYIDPDSGTAEKCHFCAHRTEIGLAPACAVVCPTEAIIPGDFDDPESLVSRIRAGEDLSVRKEEAGTKPNVFYKETEEAGLDPGLTNAAGGYLWANQVAGDPLDAERYLGEAEKYAEELAARTTYDVDHQPWWGGRVSAYLVTKSAAAGVVLASLPYVNRETGLLPAGLGWLVPAIATLFLAITTALLVMDLKRPERFLYILLKPNWSSWLVKGSVALMAFGGLLAAQLGIAVLGLQLGSTVQLGLHAATGVSALLAAIYTAWLFRQAKGRVLWMKRGLELNLAAQALIAGGVLMVPLAMAAGLSVVPAAGVLAAGCALELLLMLVEPALAPAKRGAEYKRVMSLLQGGPFAKSHKACLVGYAVSIGLAAAIAFGVLPGWVGLFAVSIAAVTLIVAEDVFVRAGQALPIS